MAITWFTKPARSFASYYYYLLDKKVLVRIRLELGRSDGGKTKAMYHEDTLVGLGQENLTDEKDVSLLEDGEIPGTGLFEYDWEDGAWGDRHEGNSVTDRPTLPRGIDERSLAALALKCITAEDDIPLTDSDASEDNLSAAILAAIT